MNNSNHINFEGVQNNFRITLVLKSKKFKLVFLDCLIPPLLLLLQDLNAIAV
jgi:hypothetical protein